MSPVRQFLSFLLLLITFPSDAADAFLVEDGKPRSVIVISEAPTRMQRVAAEEFRMQIEKISGARLPIVTKPSEDWVNIFIGASTDNPVSAEGLQYGAYRIESGANWLGLVGDDSDFEPIHPFGRNNGDLPRAQEEWEEIVRAPYGMPSRTLYKNKFRLPGETGKPDGAVTEPKEMLEVWDYDERGSFNAVCDYMRTLGFRWFMPGELGEVAPEKATIPLAVVAKSVKPDFPLRQFNFRFGNTGHDTAMWAMRLGLRSDSQIHLAHGMAGMTNNEATFAEHPEWFALYGDKRDFKAGDSKCQLCYSADGLVEETVKYARALLDNYHFKCVSVMPPDGYTAICHCDKCDGKDSPDRHERGLLSNHVWEFTTKVAKEIAKSHPDALVVNGGYGAYTLPPDNIKKLEPNILVCIVGGRRPVNKAGHKGEGKVSPEALRAEWSKKTDNPILFFENYPFTDRGWYLPTFSIESIVDSVNATKGISYGEDIWLSASRDFATEAIGFNHFLVYFTARMYWGETEKEGRELFQEYCEKFYGPAAEEMSAFFTYCEANWKGMEREEALAATALNLFEKAKAKVDIGSNYGRRVGLIDDFLVELRMKAEQLSQKRGRVPKVRLVGEAYDIEIDGDLDDEYWKKCPSAATGRLGELQTGRTPTYKTSFKAGWIRNDLYFAIRCEELPGTTPVSTASREDDTAIWKGDAVELLLATEAHSYYQIAISPDGTVVDQDRSATGAGSLKWDSKAEVATRIHEDHWTVEIRIPVTQDENDPLHLVLGNRPIQSLPWHINVCRQRIREDGQEFSALSPTGSPSFHVPMKFAHFYDGQSHEFNFDPEITDFAMDFNSAIRSRDSGALLNLAEREENTDFQKSLAIEQALVHDRKLDAAIIDQIALEPIRKAASMQQLLTSRMVPELIALFKDEDIAQWPFWKRGDGYRLRGRAYMNLKEGEAAEADLSEAIKWISDPRIQEATSLLLGQNRERNLEDDVSALSAYRVIVDGRERIGGADQYGAIQGIARILTRQSKYEEALETLNRVDIDKLQGSWKDHFEKLLEEINAAKATQ